MSDIKITGLIAGSAASATDLFEMSQNISTTPVSRKVSISQILTFMNNNITAPAGTLTGTTLNSTVVNSSLTSVGTLVNLIVTNPISGSITGNSSTVTTNANLTGAIISIGNATSISNSVNLPVNPTTTTQSSGDNSTRIATTAFVSTAIANASISGGLNYVNVTTTSQTLSAGNVYCANSSSLITFTLPASPNAGDVFQIIGLGSGGWTIAQNSGQSIITPSGTTTVGVGGSLSSNRYTDSVICRCVTALTGFLAYNIQSAGLAGV